MSDMLGDGLAWLNDQRQTHLSQPVLYQRGEVVVQVAATIGRTVFAVDQRLTGARLRTVSRDYIIPVESLTSLGEPQRGDRITEGGRVHEVLAPTAEPHWRWAEVDRLAYRIHTKELKTD